MAQAESVPAPADPSARLSLSKVESLDARQGLFARMRARLAQRTDSEHETAFNRFALTACVSVYLIGASLFGDSEAHRALAEFAVAYAIFNLCAIAIFLSILHDINGSPLRRTLAICIDLGFLSYLIHVGDSATALLYPLHLWVIFGNGFRFGTRYLAIATGVSTLTFSAVVITTPFWRDNISLSLGLLAGGIVLPAYVSVLIRKLSEAKRQAEEANRAKSLFLASVSHELRTPLNAIIGLSDLLSEAAADEEQVDMSRTIGTAGRSLLALINSILDFSQKEATGTREKLEEVDLFSLLASTRDMLAVQANARGLWFALHVTPRTPQFIIGDIKSIEEILVNLVGNALKFTEAGYVAIFVDAIETAPARVKLRIEVSDTGIGIAPEVQAKIFESFTQADETIIDRFGGSGLGLAIVKKLVEAKQGQIGVKSAPGAGSTFWLEFECNICAEETEPRGRPPQSHPWFLLSEDQTVVAFAQELGSLIKPVSSAGDLERHIAELKKHRINPRPVIILDQRYIADLDALARQLRGKDFSRSPMLIALKDNASIEVPSRELYLTSLPRPLETAAFMNMRELVSWAERKNMARATSRKAAKHLSLKILVAEDNKTNQKVIAKILERAGHTVQLADNGELALEAMIDGHFDVVLADLNMPVLNGIEMTKLYRFVAVDRPHLPIIALTADATEEAEIRCTEAGLDNCLTKPIDPDLLLKVLDEIAAGLPEAETDRAEQIPARSEPKQAASDAPDDSNADSNEPAIDASTLAYLQKLGGRDFVSDLLDQYVTDAARMLHELSDAVAEENLPKFQDRVHALRSCSANVGAKAIYNLCLSWREIDAYDLAVRGEDHMKMLEAEFAKAQSALGLYEEG